jgi:Uma2 family endonuclease
VLPEHEITLDDVASMAAADGAHRYELANGALTITPPADSDHASIVMRLAGWLLKHGYDPDLVKADAGLRAGGKVGRTPDLMVLRARPPRTVWIDPIYVALVVEVISDGSEDIDRKVKPAEYAGAGIMSFWRVERADEVADSLVSLYTLDASVGGYRPQRTCSLRELLTGPPPDLDAAG